MRAEQPLYLHVGLPKTGTTFLQQLLAESRDELRAAGFIYPFVRPEAMFQAAVEVRDDYARWGLDAGELTGTWQALLDKAGAFDGTALISHEMLAGTTRAQIEALRPSLQHFEVHVVVTARDLARQVPAHWQEAVKNGETFSFARYTREVLREPGARNSRLWEEQDLVRVLRRWSRLTTPDRVHVVIAPPTGTEPSELWRRFAEATGVPVEAVLGYGAGDGAPRRNESLSTPAVHLLRRVNRAMRGTLDRRTRAYVVKRLFAQDILARPAGHAGPTARAPQALRGPLSAVAEEWVACLEGSGFAVHGDLDELRPTEFGGPHPDELDIQEPGLVPAAAALLGQIASKRDTFPRARE